MSKRKVNMIITNAKEEQLDEITTIYELARKFMKETGNPTQWVNNYPTKELLLDDIKKKQLYVIQDESNDIICVFAFILGKDECYKKIYDGAWLNDLEYGTIHRIASSGKTKNTFELCLDFCKNKTSNIRIDTHKNNKVMQHKIEKNGFIKCGVVFMSDNTERIAYQLIVN